MKYHIISEAGSDSSYDLIVQVVRPRPHNGVCFIYFTNNRSIKVMKLVDQIYAYAASITEGLELGFQVYIPQRIPDSFVWKARMERALEKARHTENYYERNGNT